MFDRPQYQDTFSNNGVGSAEIAKCAILEQIVSSRVTRAQFLRGPQETINKQNGVGNYRRRR